MAINMLDEMIGRWLQPPYSYILLSIIIIVACYFLFKKFFQPLKEHFKGEGIDYVIKELNIKKSFSKFSRLCKNGKLYHNLGKVDVERVMLANVKVKDSKETKDRKFILFKTNSSIISKIPILNTLVKSDYFIIDNDDKFIIKNQYRDTWTVKPDVFLHKFADVWICSEQGTSFLTDLIYKRTYENAREEEMNYIKRVVWYNDLYASKMTKEYVEHELTREDFERKVQRETGVTPQKK